MKKTSVLAVLALVVVLLASSVAMAQVPFFIDAELPTANAATFGVSRVLVGPPDTFTPLNTSNLDFGILSLNVDNIFVPLPAIYWTVDIGSNGAGLPDLTFVYTDTANPNGAINNGNGLGGHATINFAEVVTNPDSSQTTNNITTVALGDVAGLPGGGIDETQYANGFLRCAVGVATDNSVANASPFTTLDQPGTYSGTLTITATFD